jgi:hypothetical protein
MSRITATISTGLAVILLPGCVAAPVVLTGVGVASVAVNETTGKTITDHTVSSVNGKDCRVVRALKHEDICQPDIPKIQITTTGVTPSSVTDLEARYR